MAKGRTAENLPVIALRDMVVFPHAKVPFIVGRSTSIEAVKAAVEAQGEVFLVMQRDAEVREPSPRDLHLVGTVGRIVHYLRLPDGNYKLLVEGRVRARVVSVLKEERYLTAQVVPLKAADEDAPEAQAARARLVAALDAYAKVQGAASFEPVTALLNGGELSNACDELAARLGISAAERQEILETVDTVERLRKLEMLLHVEADKLRLDQKLQRQVQRQVEQAQREYLLNEKMKAIQKELGRKSEQNDIEELQRKVADAGMPAEAREKAEQEMRRLEGMPAMSAEATVVRSYLDWLVAVPWSKRTRERRDFDHAARILDEDHHGLEKVKERILEFLAVRSLQKGKASRGSILCFVGPPGVGKTSLGRSIARATARKFVHLSLGGVRDEAEIRGHRRTYIGAYPGRVVQMMRKAGTRNPVMLLDEIDKMSMDFRGDPSAALLEVLDPEHNKTFIDHYLDTEYDLSEVMFICTANVLHTVPDALRDRLEVLRLPGYTTQEKIVIGERFLLPKQLEAHGLGKGHLRVAQDGFAAVIEHYTREAGVRNLEREVASLCRKVATKVVRNRDARVEIAGLSDVRALLGVPRFRASVAERQPEVGVATGLAWTEAGGQILSVEATRMKGRGKLIVTGQLGEVMQESLQAALSFVRARASRLGLSENVLRDQDIHVHVPEGAIPKDGPSAGITLAVAVASALTGRRVRNDVALTGEITLRGRVLPVGGIKEKLMAAHRVGLRNVVLPAENARDLEDVPAEVRDDLAISFVESMDEVLEIALLPLSDEAVADSSAASPPPPADEAVDADLRRDGPVA